MTIEKLREQLAFHIARYALDITSGELGSALGHREEIGKIVLRNSALLISSLDQLTRPTHAQDDNDERLPF